jgi:hypothetical protein
MSALRRLAPALAAAAGLAATASPAAGAPVVTGLAASCGDPAGGTIVVVQGAGLAADDTVAFGATPATATTYFPAVTAPGQLRRPAAIAAQAPPGTGTVHVTVTSSGGESSAPTAADLYTYAPSGPRPLGLCGASTAFVDPATGTPLTRAGGHPDMTLSFSFTTTPDATGAPGPTANPRDIDVTLPEGVIGDPAAIPVAQRCTQKQLSTNACPVSAQVGSATVITGGGPLSSVLSPQNVTLPVYSVDPPPGAPAELALLPLSSINLNVAVPILIHLVKDATGAYRLVATIRNLLQAKPVVGLSMVLFGTPRGATRPFMTFAPSCAQGPLTTTVSVASWVDPGARATADAASAPPSTGCGAQPFAPALRVTPATTQADAASGYEVAIDADQAAGAAGEAASPLRDVTVTLPPGVTINPSVADGAEVCTPEAFGLDDAAPSRCPDASAIGTVTVTTPLLDAPLTGAIRLAQSTATPTVPANPFKLFVEAVGSGLDVKLQGTLTADERDGRLHARFTGLPPVPIASMDLRFAGGPRAPLANPTGCGPATTTATLTPWSGAADATATSTFGVDADGRGGGCPSSWPGAPGFSAGPTNATAGQATGFTVTVTRGERQASLTSLSVTTPPGFSGLIANVPRCADGDAARGTCPAASRVGSVTVAAGSGDPYTLRGDAFLTGPTDGAPFGLAFVVDPVAGPFNLQAPFGAPVVIRARIAVEPRTARLTISAPLPQMQDGVPLRLRLVNVTIDRGDFAINPTNCSAMAVTGTVGDTAVSSPFQVRGCDRLPFAPRLAATVTGHPSKANGAGLAVAVAVPRGSANLRTTSVTLPTQLAARFATLQLACTRPQWEAGPGACARAAVGSVRATTPVLPDPLTGTIYLVASPTGLPTLETVLQGDGVSIPLTGAVTATKAGLRTTFDAIPDVTITTFALSLPAGPHSVLQATSTDLCGLRLAMPVAFTGQNGKTVGATLAVTPTGCPRTTRAVRVLGAEVGRRSLVLRLRLTRSQTVRVSSRYVRTRTARLAAGDRRLTVALNARGQARVRRKGRVSTPITIRFGGSRITAKAQF